MDKDSEKSGSFFFSKTNYHSLFEIVVTLALAVVKIECCQGTVQAFWSSKSFTSPQGLENHEFFRSSHAANPAWTRQINTTFMAAFNFDTLMFTYQPTQKLSKCNVTNLTTAVSAELIALRTSGVDRKQSSVRAWLRGDLCLLSPCRTILETSVCEGSKSRLKTAKQAETGPREQRFWSTQRYNATLSVRLLVLNAG